MAYRKFNIYDGVRISDKVLSAGVVAGILAIVLLMVIGSIRGFTVDFQTGGGEIVAEQHLRYGEKVKEPETPSREGYV
ncbi:MAG: InlB B-repeat-containing protein, partial [Clostridia bacterium]|nr:InlB B-repeat-containing protein [Clostridia bacterium]